MYHRRLYSYGHLDFIILLESIVPFLYASSSFSSSAYKNLDVIVPPFLFPLVFDKSLLQAVSILKGLVGET